MSDIAVEISPVPETKSKKRGRRWLLLLVILALMGGGIYAGFHYLHPKYLKFISIQRQTHVQILLMQDQLKTLQQQKSNSNDLLSQLQAQLAHTTDTLNQVQMQLQQQQSALLQLRQNPAARALLPAELNYLIQLAHTSLIAEHSSSNAIMFLQTAKSLATFSYQANLAPVVAALNQDIANLQAIDQPDISTILSQLSIAKQLVDQMPLTSTMPTTDTPIPATADNAVLPWWKRFSNATWEELKKVIKVQKTSSTLSNNAFDQLSLQYLKQNMGLLLTQTELAVAQYNQALYQANLQELEHLIETHVIAQPGMSQALSIVKTLQSADIAPPLPDVDASLTAISQLLALPTSSMNPPAPPAPVTTAPVAPASATPANNANPAPAAANNGGSTDTYTLVTPTGITS